MDEVILRVLKGEATPFEEERLKRWRAESPGNEARVVSVARIWKLTDLGDSTLVHPQDVESLSESIVTASEARRNERDSTSNKPEEALRWRRPPRTLVPWGIALAACAAAIALGIRTTDVRRGLAPAPSAGVSIALNARTLRLDDGSFVRLSPGSSLEARLEEDVRTVSLEGRAFFAVAPDGSRPFIVETSSGRIRVLGTRFEVSQVQNGLRAVVVEGLVEMTTVEGQVELGGGSVGFATPGSAPSAQQVDDVWAFLDWPGGLLVFHDTPLAVVARELQRHFHLPVRVDSPPSDSPGISASFEDGETLREIAETLCTVTRSACRITPDSVTITPPAGEPR